MLCRAGDVGIRAPRTQRPKNFGPLFLKSGCLLNHVRRSADGGQYQVRLRSTGVRRPLPSPVIAAAFLLAAFATRLPVLHRSVLDWDESLYFLMAQSWHAGHLPYTTIWDNKPLGIYAIFAAFQAVFGERIVAMRLAAVAFAAALAWLVHGITLALTTNRRAALLAGCAVILCSLSNDGLSANTELFMASFTAAAVLLALRGGPAPAIGLLLGCAFMVKYVAVFEAPVVFFLILSQRPGRWLRSAAWMLAGAALPLLAVVLSLAAEPNAANTPFLLGPSRV
ncbi:MAG: hypothetical protein B7Z81_07080 [Acidocella sp. 20-61-6]|nr:MAG: hypothetical protein B7Z81_07080 [Acidocella sp. 20-61-6]